MALLVGLSAIAISAMSASWNPARPSRAAATRWPGSTDKCGLRPRTRRRTPHSTAAFLIGKTITIGGAALQARVEAAVKEAGGVVLSSQIDLQGPQAAEGFISLTESLEINQASLQTFLYDLEAGMPISSSKISRSRRRSSRRSGGGADAGPDRRLWPMERRPVRRFVLVLAGASLFATTAAPFRIRNRTAFARDDRDRHRETRRERRSAC